MTTEKTLHHIEWPLVIEKIVKHCKNLPAVEIINNLSPLTPEEASERIAYISELKELIEKTEGPDISGLVDISPLLETASKGGVLSLEDIVSVRDFLLLSEETKIWFKTHKDENRVIRAELDKTADTSTLNELITGSITGTGDINENRYPELKKIKTAIRDTASEAEKALFSIIHNPSNEKILQEKIYTTRNERYVVLVKSGMKGRIKGGIQDFSASGATIFVEPADLIPLNDKLIMLNRDLKNEILKILKELSASIGKYRDEIEINLVIFSYLSAVEALARFSIQTLSNPPEISSDPVLKLIGARHPLLQLMIPDTIVSNDIELGITYDCLIISGANTGGKTALLKTAGLCTHMAACGMHIPAAADSRAGIFSRIMADIGDDQNISESLSTFSGQIVEFNRMLNEADSSTLLLIDEIMAGTNPDEGTLLAAAVLEALAEKGAKLIAATHYPGLKELQARDSRFMNASVVFDAESMKPVYKLIVGLPGLSYAFEIAENCGLPREIIQKASQMKSDTDRSTDFLLERASKRDRELSEELARVNALRNDLESQKSIIEQKQHELREKSRRVNKAEANNFINELEQTREKLSSRLKELDNMNRKDLEERLDEINSSQEDTRNKLKEEVRLSAEEKYSAVEKAGITPGDRVFIIPLEKTGTVEEVDNRKKRARVLFGSSIRSFFSFNDLLIDKKAADINTGGKKTSGIKMPVKSSEIPLTVQTSYNTIDLRGKRVEDGLMYMESELDRMSRSGVTAAVIIHGHGTGAMKEAVRTSLKDSCYCTSFRPGEQREGGDGVTIAELS